MREGCILVTGAAGLIGDAVRKALTARGQAVIAVDVVAATEEGLPLTVANVMDVHRLHALAAEHRFAGILHCAAYSGPMVAPDNPWDIVSVNVLGTANLLELARVHRIPRLVFCSTVTTYGATGAGPIAEDTLLRPTNVYGASKAASEQIVDAYAIQHGVDAVSIRISWVYGPRRRTACAIRAMISGALRGRPVRIDYGRDFHKQYMYIDDAVQGLLLALDSGPLPRRSYTITGGSHHTLGEVAAIVARVLPGAAIEVGTSPDPDDDPQGRFDISAAARDLGYRPAVSLEEGVRRYAEWLRPRLGAS